ncbi:hydroxysqualene dehydroxylase HpnE [Curvibacter sp. PAE-UM]|uniref:hydroxysqualene dehydroxylase HpnE n=1 Tax=Curvibacter sp. PAE-UM TaxID=1714344 RepID=UPI00070CBBBE|nr:hydroxysqualene dehydroxylase HpnE [Curvibacter sp. PAE-UM]KRI01195.1 desaturase [Curvibacter sp. PAE-UM]
MRVAVVGAGWAGMAAAVAATQAGHQVTVFEAARTLGGRARGLEGHLPDGRAVTLDNGQHILIGAYTETLRLMQEVGVDTETALQRLPLTLKFPDGAGLQLPRLPVPLDVLAGILRNGSWPLPERLGLLQAALGWKLRGFECEAQLSVADLCRTLGPHVMQELIEPLCVSALNTPAHQASAQVFLRVLRDALFGVRGGSQLLLPRIDLTGLFPQAAAHWLARHGAAIQTGTRINTLQAKAAQWQLNEEIFDRALLACSSTEAARLVAGAAGPQAESAALKAWAATAAALHFEAITTVYAWAPTARLPAPMLALRHDTGQPAQFVFDRGQLDGSTGLLAFVVSASQGERETIQAQVLQQARSQLGLDLQAVQTVVEKRATFACTPALQRPAQTIAPGLLACSDYVAGPYPATLEGAVRSGLAAAQALGR